MFQIALGTSIGQGDYPNFLDLDGEQARFDSEGRVDGKKFQTLQSTLLLLSQGRLDIEADVFELALPFGFNFFLVIRTKLRELLLMIMIIRCV